MNQYLKILLLSLVYYVIYLISTLYLIPFIFNLINSQKGVKMESIQLTFGSLPIGYILMLLFSAITIFAIEEYKRCNHDK